MGYGRQIKLFKNGRSQAVRIPRGFELPGTDAVMRQEGGRIIIEAARKPGSTTALLAWLATLEPLDKEIGEIEDLPPDDVEI